MGKSSKSVTKVKRIPTPKESTETCEASENGEPLPPFLYHLPHTICLYYITDLLQAFGKPEPQQMVKLPAKSHLEPLGENSPSRTQTQTNQLHQAEGKLLFKLHSRHTAGLCMSSPFSPPVN